MGLQAFSEGTRAGVERLRAHGILCQRPDLQVLSLDSDFGRIELTGHPGIPQVRHPEKETSRCAGPALRARKRTPSPPYHTFQAPS